MPELSRSVEFRMLSRHPPPYVYTASQPPGARPLRARLCPCALCRVTTAQPCPLAVSSREQARKPTASTQYTVPPPPLRLLSARALPAGPQTCLPVSLSRLDQGLVSAAEGAGSLVALLSWGALLDYRVSYPSDFSTPCPPPPSPSLDSHPPSEPTYPSARTFTFPT